MAALGKFLRNIKKETKSRRSLANTARFTTVFLASFLVFVYGIIPATAGFWQFMGGAHAQAASAILSSFGVQSSVNGNIISMIVGEEETDFAITQLCSGDIEIALLASLLLASIDVLLVWRVLGALLGAGLLLALNPLRIAVTLWITKGSGMEAGDAYHSLIFRLFLFVILVLYYFAWYRAFAGRRSPAWEKTCNSLFGKKVDQKDGRP
jgi:exosortase/archaeosortase family protein